MVNIVLNCLPDYRITSRNWSYFRQEQTIWIWQLVGIWEQRLWFYLKNKSITPIERQCRRSCVHGWKAWSFAVLKHVKIFVTKGRVLNIDKRNSRKATIVHKETKLSPLRKGIVSCETQYSKMTVSGFTARQRIRKLTWHGSFMQTDLTHTPHQIC